MATAHVRQWREERILVLSLSIRYWALELWLSSTHLQRTASPVPSCIHAPYPSMLNFHSSVTRKCQKQLIVPTARRTV